MRIALIHDDFMQSGGAESLFATIAAMYPNAPIISSLVNWDKLPTSISGSRVRPSFMQKIPLSKNFFKAVLPFYPIAFESFNFDEFDLVISSTTRFAKAIITKPKTVHICYVNSLPRFLWNQDRLKKYLPLWLKIITTPLMNWLRRWDIASSARVDYFIANSKNVQKKIKHVYNRDSKVVYPAVDTSFFVPKTPNNLIAQPPNYYLIVSRLVQWKKIDVAIEACQQSGVKLIIVGEGPDKGRLKQILNQVQNDKMRSSPKGQTLKGRIEFSDNTNREELRSLYQNAKALIVTQDEDFGIASVEAQACGTPVIGFKKGGTAEIVVDKKTGVLFAEQSVLSLKDAILTSSRLKYEKAVIRKNALRFTKKIFEEKLKQTIENYVNSAQP